jgi:metal-sulfur cluster biosynthetic enzyme
MSQDTSSKVTWKIENTHPDLAPSLEEALREVVDPELGLNIIELGLVRDAEINPEDDTAQLTMILTTPFCPYGPAMLEMTRQKAETALGRSTLIEMGTEMWDLSMMEEGTGADWGMF